MKNVKKNTRQIPNMDATNIYPHNIVCWSIYFYINRQTGSNFDNMRTDFKDTPSVLTKLYCGKLKQMFYL